MIAGENGVRQNNPDVYWGMFDALLDANSENSHWHRRQVSSQMGLEVCLEVYNAVLPETLIEALKSAAGDRGHPALQSYLQQVSQSPGACEP